MFIMVRNSGANSYHHISAPKVLIARAIPLATSKVEVYARSMLMTGVELAGTRATIGGTMTEASRVLAIDQCYCTSLRKASRRISQFYDGVLMPTGLRATQFAILATLDESPSIAINELAVRLDLDRTTTGKNLRPLQREGLIAVVQSKRDGRSRTVSMTPAGVARFREATPLWARAQEQFEEHNQMAIPRLRATLNGLGVPEGE
jgi:DNA-binding MarR family transcriptional regulator